MRFLYNILDELQKKMYNISFRSFPQNMKNAKRLQIAESLDFYSLSYNKTKATLQQILDDPKYAKNAKKLSNIVNDQMEKPLDRAIWWIEWVLRNPNIYTLKSPVNTLGYVVGNSLDVISFATILFMLHMFMLYKILSLICKFLFETIIKRMNCFNKIRKYEKLQ